MPQTIFNQQRGSAAITAIITMIVLGLLGTAYVTLSTTELRIAAGHRDGAAAQYLAEAGAMYARIQLRSDITTNIRASTNNATGITITSAVKNAGTATQGTYTVTVNNPNAASYPYQRQIVSVGTVNGAKRTVKLVMDLSQNNIPSSGLPTGGDTTFVFANCIFSNGSMTLGNINIYGDVRTNGQVVSAGRQTKIYSSAKPNPALLPGTLTVTSDANKPVAGLGVGNIAVSAGLNFPLNSSQRSLYQNAAVKTYSGATTLSGTYTSATLPPGIHFFNGDLTLANGTVMTGIDGLVLYATGNVYLKNNVKMGKTLVLSEQSITIRQNARFDTTLVVADGNVIFEQNSWIGTDPPTYAIDGVNPDKGGIAIAHGTLTVNNNSSITYKKDLVSYFTSAVAGYTSGKVTLWSNF